MKTLNVPLLVIFCAALAGYDLWLIASGRFQPALMLGMIIWLGVLYLYSVLRSKHRDHS